MKKLTYYEIEDYIEEHGCCPYCGGKRIVKHEVAELFRVRNAITGNLKKESNRYMANLASTAPTVYVQFVCKKCGELTDMERI